MLRYTTDRTRPGLVALHDIRSGNGAGLFLQPRNTLGLLVSNNYSIDFHEIRWRQTIHFDHN